MDTFAAWTGTVFTVTLTLRFSGSPVMLAVIVALTPAFSALTTPVSASTLTFAALLVKVKSALSRAAVLSVPKTSIFALSPSCRPIFVLCSYPRLVSPSFAVKLLASFLNITVSFTFALLPLPSLAEAVTVTVPGFTKVTVPSASTVATDVLLLFHVNS